MQAFLKVVEMSRYVRDGLPKFRDVPKEMGGSGVTLDE
jgi:hypothetical protein